MSIQGVNILSNRMNVREEVFATVNKVALQKIISTTLLSKTLHVDNNLLHIDEIISSAVNRFRGLISVLV